MSFQQEPYHLESVLGPPILGNPHIIRSIYVVATGSGYLIPLVEKLSEVKWIYVLILFNSQAWVDLRFCGAADSCEGNSYFRWL